MRVATAASRLLTMHTDDVFRLEEISHAVGRVGVNAAVSRYRRVSSGQANPPSLGLVLQLV